MVSFLIPGGGDVMFSGSYKDLIKCLFVDYKEFEIRAPNGEIYRFSTNAMDEETFSAFRNSLVEAVRKNDQEAFERAWKDIRISIQAKRKAERKLEEFKNKLEKLFSKNDVPHKEADRGSTASEGKDMTEEDIDKQIQSYEEKIKQLKLLKIKKKKKKTKKEIQLEIQYYKQLIDQKLDLFSEHTGDEQMKKRLAEEMADLSNKVKELEKKLHHAVK